jgi:hypothetical protein
VKNNVYFRRRALAFLLLIVIISGVVWLFVSIVRNIDLSVLMKPEAEVAATKPLPKITKCSVDDLRAELELRDQKVQLGKDLHLLIKTVNTSNKNCKVETTADVRNLVVENSDGVVYDSSECYASSHGIVLEPGRDDQDYITWNLHRAGEADPNGGKCASGDEVGRGEYSAHFVYKELADNRELQSNSVVFTVE